MRLKEAYILVTFTTSMVLKEANTLVALFTNMMLPEATIFGHIYYQYNAN